jgi:TonB family protein
MEWCRGSKLNSLCLMPVTQIPSRDPLSRDPMPGGSSTGGEPPEQRDLFEAQHWEAAYRGFNPNDVPHLLIQLQDDLSRARKREALWLSVIIHLFVVILLWNSEKLMDLWPHKAVDLAIRADDRSKDATFLELPPDEQKVTRRPDSKIISDKDRIATSKAPQINREDLKKILQSMHPARPGPNTPQPPAPSPPAQNPVAQNQPPAAQDSSQGLTPPQPTDQAPKLQTPPQNRPVPNFNAQMTPGSAIEQAARAASENRGRYAGGGEGGDSGLVRGKGRAHAAMGPAEILSDTMGVEFGPYLTRILQIIKQNWIIGLPESAYPPIWKQGRTAIEFTILKNGQVSGMVLRSSSGDVPLDRAAWGGITASDPLPALPKEFPGPNIVLRIGFYCNMEIPGLK